MSARRHGPKRRNDAIRTSHRHTRARGSRDARFTNADRVDHRGQPARRGVFVCGIEPSPAPLTTPRPIGASPSPSAASIPSASPSAAAASIAPSPLPPPGSGDLPIRGSAREISTHTVLTAPGQDGTLFVVIPAAGSARDPGPASTRTAACYRAGRSSSPMPPGAIDRCPSTTARSGSSARSRTPMGYMFGPIAAFAFDADGRVLAGWPVERRWLQGRQPRRRSGPGAVPQPSHWATWSLRASRRTPDSS